ncbi:hypothetical protein BBJ28_00004591, partial [Nothophytophthora sp. Chile5]
LPNAARTMSAAAAMKYRFLGNTGLLVSKLSYGSFVTFNTQLDFEKAYAVMEHAFKRGVNFFDTAEGYAGGQSEVLMGKSIQTGIERGVWSREDLVVSTKIFFGTKHLTNKKTGPNEQGLSRKHIVEGTKASLQRLGLGYVDTIFCHRPDPCTPIEETVSLSETVWEASGPDESAVAALGARDEPRDRERKYGYGLTTWSPLAFGILTGKYSKGIPEVSLQGLLAVIAKEIGCSLAQLAIAWCVSNEKVSTVILGASSIAQLDENLNALTFVDKLTPEIRARIDEIAAVKLQLPVPEARLVAMREQWL